MQDQWRQVIYYTGFAVIFGVTLALVILGAGATQRSVLSDAYVGQCCSLNFDATLEACRVFSEHDVWCEAQSAAYAAEGLAANRLMASAFFFCLISVGAWEVGQSVLLDRVDLYADAD